MRGGTDGAKEQGAWALAHLAWTNADNQAAIASAGGIAPLIELVHSGTDGAKEQAAMALRNLALRNTDNQAVIASMGENPPLVELTRSSTRSERP